MQRGNLSAGRVYICRPMSRLRESDRRPYKWGLLLTVVMAVEFWVIATSVVAHQF